MSSEIILAAKCAPEEAILMDIEKAGLTAVELYTNHEWLRSINRIKQSSKEFSFRYAVHAPTDGYEPDILAELVDEIKAEIVVSEAKASYQTLPEFKMLNKFYQKWKEETYGKIF